MKPRSPYHPIADLGSGTGLNREILPESRRQMWVKRPSGPGRGAGKFRFMIRRWPAQASLSPLGDNPALQRDGAAMS